MRNERAWPQQCWKSCANGSNIVALRFGDHGTKEMLGVVGRKSKLLGCPEKPSKGIGRFYLNRETDTNKQCKIARGTCKQKKTIELVHNSA